MDELVSLEQALVVDRRNPGWVTRYGTRAGLELLEPRQSTQVSAPQSPAVELGDWRMFNLNTAQPIVAIQEVPDGRLFAAVQYSGLRVYAPTDDGTYAWSEIHADFNGLQSDNVTSLAIAGGELWVGTSDAGVSLLNLNAGTWRSFHPGTVPMPSVTVNRMNADPTFLPDYVIVYISTPNGVARYTFDGYSEEWITILPGTNVWDTGIQSFGGDQYIWFATGNNIQYFDGVNWVTYNEFNTGACAMQTAARVLVDREKTVWFVSLYTPPPRAGDESISPDYNRIGVCTYSNGTWTHYNTITPGLPSNYATDLSLDSAGRVWISLLGGAAVYDQGAWLIITQGAGYPIFSDQVNAVGAVGESAWFGHFDATALSQYSPNWQQFTNGEMGGSGGNPGAVLIESTQTWIGLGDKLARYDGSLWDTNAIPGNSAEISALARGGDGLLWIGTAGNGLYAFDGIDYTHHTSADGLPGNEIRALASDTSGRVWAAIQGGLALRANGYWLSFSSSNSPLTDNNLTALAVDATDRLWIGTGSQGINILDSNAQGNGAWSTQTTADGLPSNTINALATDPTGQVWAGTAAGLSAWNPAAQGWTLYNSEPTLSVAADPQGRIWIGTSTALYLLEGGAWQPFHVTGSMLGGDQFSVLASDGELLWATGWPGDGSVAVRGVLTGPVGFFPPVITSFSPQQGAPGDTITIQGDYFDERGSSFNEVRFGDNLNPNLRGLITSASQNTLTVQVPQLAQTGLLYVRAHGLNGASATPFTVVPKISYFSPTCIGIGSLVRVYGAGFNSSSANIYIRVGDGPWRFADVADPGLIRQFIRPGDGSGYIQVRIGENGPVITSGTMISISTPQVVGYAVQQAIEGEAMVWGKRTLVSLSLQSSGSGGQPGCAAQVSGGAIEWKLVDNTILWDTNAFLPYNYPLQVKTTPTGTALDKTVSFVLGGNSLNPNIPFSLSSFNGVRIRLVNGPISLLTYEIPASAFNFIEVGTRHHFLNMPVLPQSGWTNQQYKDYMLNANQGLEHTARVYPQQDIRPLYGSSRWMRWPIAGMYFPKPFVDLNTGDFDTIRSFVDDYRDLINDSGSPFLDQAMAIIDWSLYGGGPRGKAVAWCGNPFSDCARYTAISFNDPQELTSIYLQEAIHALEWVQSGSPSHASNNVWHSRYDEGQWGEIENCKLDQTFRQALIDQTGAVRRVVLLQDQQPPYEFPLVGCEYNDQPRSAMSYVPNAFDWTAFLEPLDYRYTMSWLFNNDNSDIDPFYLGQDVLAAHSQSLRINGIIDHHDVVTVTMSYLTDTEGELTPAEWSGSYALELRSMSGELLYRQEFSLPTGDTHHTDSPSHEGEESLGRFSLRVPFPAGTQRVEIRHTDSLLWSQTVSANAPVVSLLTPNGGTYSAADPLSVSWNASDTDGDTLQFTLEYSPDNGTTWTPVAVHLEGNNYTWRPDYVPASVQARLRLRASDGFNTGEAISAPFTLTARPPIALIYAPEGGTTFTEGAIAHLRGGSLTADGLDQGTFAWDLDGAALGFSQSLTATLDTIGVHTISLHVIADGLSDTSSVTVNVLPDYDRDSLPNAWELSYRLNPLDPTDALEDTDVDRLSNLREYQLDTDPRTVDTDGDSANDGDEVDAGTDPLRPDQIPASSPVLQVGAQSLGFLYRQGDPLPEAWQLWVTNGGTGSLSWTATKTADWLSVTPGSGIAPAEMTVSADPTGLRPGVHSAQITITAGGAQGSPYILNVTLTIYPESGMFHQVYLPMIKR
jgi:ligand-binding sensor domain-containing protein